MGLPNMGLPGSLPPNPPSASPTISPRGPPELPVPSFPKKKACEPSIQMRQLHWGKLPDAKIKGTIWEKDVTDEHVKVRSPLIALDYKHYLGEGRHR